MHRHRTAQRRIVRGHTALLSAGVYHTAPFLQLYAYTPYSASCESCCYASVSHSAGLQSHGSMLRLRAAGMYENHIVPDCRHVGLYHTALCLQAYTIQCLTVCVCNTALCLRACTIHRACLLAYTISYRAMPAGVYRTMLVCRCMPYSAISVGMYHTSRLSVGVYHIIQSYVCRCVPYSACLQVYAIQRSVCVHVPASRLSVGVYRIVQSYVCKLIPYSACLRDYAIHLMSAGMYRTSRLSDCGHVGLYHIELCLQAYTVQCLSTGVCHTALCLRA